MTATKAQGELTVLPDCRAQDLARVKDVRRACVELQSNVRANVEGLAMAVDDRVSAGEHAMDQQHTMVAELLGVAREDALRLLGRVEALERRGVRAWVRRTLGF